MIDARITLSDEHGPRAEALAFVLPVKTGDVVVLRLDKETTMETAQNLQKAFRDLMPEGVAVVVVGPNIDLELNHRVEIARRDASDGLRRNFSAENTILNHALEEHKAAFHKVAYAKSLHEARSIALSMIERGEYP